SDDCLSTRIPSMYATELWVMSKDASLPPHIERYKHGDIEMVSLGFDPAKCSTVSSEPQKAVDDLIGRLRSDENSFGVVIGYHFAEKRPEGELQLRMKSAKETLERSGIPNTRYSISYATWHADE